MEALTAILEKATRAIGRDYFHLPIDGADPVYRERVYCYELYHQMRSRWPQNSDWRLNGEVDKQAHPYFGDGGAPKPDLLVHQPGTGNNHAIIEVKPCRASADGIEKDLNTLTTFSCRFGYRRPIYLVFGPNAEQTATRIRSTIESRQGTASVELWLHRSSGRAAEPFWTHDGLPPCAQ